MGNVVVVFRVIPDDIRKTDEVRKALERLKPDRLEEEDVAFGLKAFKFAKIVPDSGGELDKLENKLTGIQHANVELVTASRAL